MSDIDAFIKRLFDIVVSILALAVLWPVMLIAAALIYFETGENGFFTQKRIGRHGKAFTLVKIRTMRPNAGTSITTRGDPRITPVGAWLRRLKIDELPQLLNIVKGEMSLVGPRPDVPGYADALQGGDRAVLDLRPGITGPATLKYRNEEILLAQAEDPVVYNDTVIWPDKVRINLEYLNDYSMLKDVRYLLATVRLAQHRVD